MNPYISISALTAFGTSMNATAKNVANANTPGYKAERVVKVENKHGGVSTVLTRNLSAGPMLLPASGKASQEMVEMSNVNLAREMVDMIINKHGYQANRKVIKVMDEIKGSVLDIIK